jgi:predicted transposase YbfD/YdcC
MPARTSSLMNPAIGSAWMLMPSMTSRAPGQPSAPRQDRERGRSSRWMARSCEARPAAGKPGRHLLAALDQTQGVVLGQAEVGAKTNEIPMASALLDRIDVSGAVVRAGAMHAQRCHAEYLAGRGAQHLFTVKGNQSALRAQIAALPCRQVPVARDTRERGHGRAERRTLKVTSVAAGLAFPHAAQRERTLQRKCRFRCAGVSAPLEPARQAAFGARTPQLKLAVQPPNFRKHAEIAPAPALCAHAAG